MKTALIALLALGLCLPLVAADKDKPSPKDLLQVKALAEKGDRKAQYFLGRLYSDGIGVGRDLEEGMKWLRKAADQGDARAQNQVGLAYNKGLGVAKDQKEAAKWYLKSAKQGTGGAAYNLARMLGGGLGIERDLPGMFKWMLKAAELGFHPAQFLVGGLYFEGRVTRKDFTVAYAWFSIAAKNKGQGHLIEGKSPGLLAKEQMTFMAKEMTLAQIAEAENIAKRLLDKIKANMNVGQEPSEIERIKRLAENGDPASQYSLGLRYYQGKGVKKDSVTAYAWWEIAASNGNKAAARDKRILDRELTEQQVKAGRELARILKNPKMMIPQNQVVIPQNLMKFKADADKGDAGAQYMFGLWFYYGQAGLKRDSKEAAGWLLKAALQNHVEAMRILALLYRNGGPGQKADPVESMKWLRKLAEIGDAQGQLLFGMSFIEEVARGGPPKNNKELLRLFPKNKKEAVGWIRKSAVQGCVPAQYNLGVIYFEGKHLPRDFKKAFLWHSKAAERGSSDAQANLGAMYFNGDGIPRDLVKAYVWNSIAGDKRFKDAAAKRMTPEQITKAQELVKEMVKKNPKLLDRREALGFGFPKR